MERNIFLLTWVLSQKELFPFNNLSFQKVDLKKFLPVDLVDNLVARSALASTFAASLELAKEGKIEVQQNVSFGPIYVRARKTESEENG